MQRDAGWSLFAGAGLTAALTLCLAGPAMAQEATPAASPGALDIEAVDAILHDVEGNDVGTVMISDVVEDGTQVNVFVEAGALSPGEHGIHIHERGLCEADGDEPFASAGGHFNPTDAKHGGLDDPEAHAGDLGNITVEEDGSADVVIPTDRFTLAELNDADGSALIIHADRDDLQTDPDGNSGARVLCGVIFAPGDGATDQRAGTPVGEVVQEALATAIPDIDYSERDSDEAASPEPAG